MFNDQSSNLVGINPVYFLLDTEHTQKTKN